jgi:uncharacterized membrane protein
MYTYDAAMPSDAPPSLYGRLVALPILCFVAAVITDVIYTRNADMMWTNFSAWLLAIGLFTAGIATVAGLIDWYRHRDVVKNRLGWPLLLGNVIVLALALFDNFIHTRDAWTSVVPTGLVLSVLTAVSILVTAIYAATRPAARYVLEVVR